jgi:hypothetical protein
MRIQGFSADIPDAYLTMLQSNVGGNGPISYIGEVEAIEGITCC